MTKPPFATRCFFSFSSLWMAVLAVRAWQASLYFLTYIMMACTIFSFLHWNYFFWNSWLSLLDRFFASVAFLYVYFRGSGVLHNVMASLSLACFVVGSWAIIERAWDLHFVYHALFRYFAFWACCCFIAAPHASEFLFFSTIYILHYLVMIEWLIDEVNASKRGGYNPPVNKSG